MSEKKTEEAPFLSNIGLMLTYKCTVACPHCIVKAGPSRTEEMSAEDAFRWIDQIKLFRDGFISSISLTGGEPFYNTDLTLKIADYANKQGLIVSVVSNAYWATTKERALKMLESCKSIQMISISTDIPHQKFISFDHVKNAIWAAKKTGKLYNIAVATESEDDPEYLKLMDDILEITDREYINTAIILPVGRAETESGHKHLMVTEPPESACSMASFPIIFPNGNVIACIGPPITLPEHNPLFLGNLRKESLNEILDKAENNFILQAIRVFGPRTLVSLLKENGYIELLPEQYIDEAICDICFKLLSDKKTCDILQDLISQDESFRLKIAYGRHYYLDESYMAEKMEELK